MELVFVRHGQGEHTIDPPDSLHRDNASLTRAGEEQAKTLRREFPLTKEDVIVISPTKRTIQTALIWSEGVACERIVSPHVSPRMFPQKSGWSTLPCDLLMNPSTIQKDYPNLNIDNQSSLWREGINTLPEKDFQLISNEFLHWCKQQDKDKIYIVSHDGTITAYRQLILQQTLTRKNFLKELGWAKVRI